MIILPGDYAWLLWGWPHRFVRRMRIFTDRIEVIGPLLGRSPSAP